MINKKNPPSPYFYKLYCNQKEKIKILNAKYLFSVFSYNHVTDIYQIGKEKGKILRTYLNIEHYIRNTCIMGVVIIQEQSWTGEYWMPLARALKLANFQINNIINGPRPFVFKYTTKKVIKHLERLVKK